MSKRTIELPVVRDSEGNHYFRDAYGQLICKECGRSLLGLSVYRVTGIAKVTLDINPETHSLDCPAYRALEKEEGV